MHVVRMNVAKPHPEENFSVWSCEKVRDSLGLCEFMWQNNSVLECVCNFARCTKCSRTAAANLCVATCLCCLLTLLCATMAKWGTLLDSGTACDKVVVSVHAEGSLSMRERRGAFCITYWSVELVFHLAENAAGVPDDTLLSLHSDWPPITPRELAQRNANVLLVQRTSTNLNKKGITLPCISQQKHRLNTCGCKYLKAYETAQRM